MLRRATQFAIVLALTNCNSRAESPEAPAPRKVASAVPAAGDELVGTAIGRLNFDAWLDPSGKSQAEDPRPTLYRWWTDTCPYCARSLPNVEALRRRFEPRGLRVVAVYHPKPPRPVSLDEVRLAAERLGFHGIVAVDADWSNLRRFYLTRADRAATSASFLVDSRGIIRLVHPGMDLTEADMPKLERAIKHVLADGSETKRGT
jgi:thiol-disulfide isomerase/thioredoxin